MQDGDLPGAEMDTPDTDHQGTATCSVDFDFVK